MDKTVIQTLIDKVIGKKGLIRVPSWWMRKVLMQMADWVQEGDDANDKKIVKVKEEADGKITSLETNTNSKISTLETNTNSKISTLETNTNNDLIALKKSLHTQKCFVVETNGTNGVVIVDGIEQTIPANSKKVIIFIDTFSFHKKDFSNLGIVFIGLALTDVSSVTNMGQMFSNCSSLTSLDLTGLDTSAVISMTSMFYNCSSLTSLGLTGLDTSAVTSMHGMFNYCKRLTSLDLSSFDTSAVTDMGYMFGNCQSLTSLDLSSFDTSAVTDMANMFWVCKKLTSLILGTNFFKTSKVTSVDFSSSTEWTGDTVVTSLVTNSYDRATAGLRTMTLQLSANTKAALTDEQKAAITAKGYTIA